jgi:hypothetical protein
VRWDEANTGHGPHAERGDMKPTPLLCLMILLAAATPARAVCIFGFGNSCLIDDTTAAALLRPRVTGWIIGPLRIQHTIQFAALRHGQSGQKAGENERKIARGQAVRDHMNGTKDCGNIDTVWDAELPFETSKQAFCELARVMKARNLASVELSIGPLQPMSTGGSKQDVLLRLALTDDGQAIADRFMISRDAQSITVATGTLKFLRIVGKKGDASVANVEFAYEVVPNVWTHVQKGLPTDTLAAERRTGTVGLQKISEQWRLIHEPAL